MEQAKVFNRQDMAKEIGCKTTAIVFLTPMQICINKNLKRGKERQLPLEVILRMAKFNPDKQNSWLQVEFVYDHWAILPVKCHLGI
jgi:predicted kinase